MKLINGVDIVDVNRIRKILLERPDRFLEKIFTIREREYIEKKNYNAETISGLFAGKEAISKAIGTGIGLLSWQDMEILHESMGRPRIFIADEILKKYNIDSLEISISHERNYAIAFVIGSKII